MTATLTTFTFDRNYNNLDQVRPYYPAFLAHTNTLLNAGEQPSNDLFIGHNPALAGPDEDIAIHLLQQLAGREKVRLHREAFAALGGVPVETLDLSAGKAYRGTIAEFGYKNGGVGSRSEDLVRIIGRQGGFYVISHGRRNGRFVAAGSLFLAS